MAAHVHRENPPTVSTPARQAPGGVYRWRSRLATPITNLAYAQALRGTALRPGDERQSAIFARQGNRHERMKRPTPAPPTSLGEHEARLVDRGDASGRNIEQNRAVGQGDPMEGSRAGRETMKGVQGCENSGHRRSAAAGPEAAGARGDS